MNGEGRESMVWGTGDRGHPIASIFSVKMEVSPSVKSVGLKVLGREENSRNGPYRK